MAHADIAQLLSLRDGPLVDAQLRQHVEGCSSCSAELEHLDRVREGLRQLPEEAPPRDLWEGVRARAALAPPLADGYPAPGPSERWYGAAVGIAATAVMAISLLLLDQQGAVGPTLGPGAAATSAEPLRTPQLMDASRELERSLRAVDLDGQVVSGRTAATIAALEERIAYVDLQLSRQDLSEVQKQRLWQQRVSLLNSLVRLRYASSQRTDL